ncbi:MAG: transglutaminase-like domain-containing protein [Candidatus Thorarchaeota archaeon]|jgi:hypothetical protein
MSGSFEELKFFIKCPSTDLRQRIDILGTSHSSKMVPDRWATICQMEIPREDFENNQSEVNLNIILNLGISRGNPYRKSSDILMQELPFIWEEKPSVKEYLEPNDLVESDNPEIQELSKSLVNDGMLFWDAIDKITEWVNTRIIYSWDLQSNAYQGAAATLQSRRAICSDFVHLLLALTRAANIPSRAVLGIYKENNKTQWTVHSWTEVHDPQFGWTPIDVVVQPILIGNLGRNYLRISAGHHCAEPFYAYFSEPKESEDTLHFSVNQYVMIGKETVKFEFART